MMGARARIQKLVDLNRAVADGRAGEDSLARDEARTRLLALEWALKVLDEERREADLKEMRGISAEYAQLAPAAAAPDRWDARAPDITPEQANELRDVLRTLVPSGPAFLTSARALVARMERAELQRDMLANQLAMLQSLPATVSASLILRLRANNARLREQIEGVANAMLTFAKKKPGGQQTREKSAREIAEYFAYELRALLAGTADTQQEKA